MGVKMNQQTVYLMQVKCHTVVNVSFEECLSFYLKLQQTASWAYSLLLFHRELLISKRDIVAQVLDNIISIN